MTECSRLACFLQGKEQFLSFPMITVAGLVDGINPCAIGMMVMLLGYLLVFAKKPERVLKTGLLYVGTVFATYLVVGLGLYSFVSQFDLSGGAKILNWIVGGVLFIAGVIQFKDFLGIEGGPHLRIPTASKEKLQGLVEKTSYPTTMILGIVVTLLETPCSLPIYVGTATILSQSGMVFPLVVLYFLYYNFLFVLPLIVVLIIMWKGQKLVEMKEWEHKAKRWMHLSLAVVLLGMGIWLLFK
ncbi:MAG: cytochrome c biogenesis protein transmembrane region [uncultured bacterium]|nr:MAG: cytochrome c biogenesis protein transmembrane region [uncultured bacterium]